MPRKRVTTEATAPMKVESIPPTVEKPKHNRRVKVLAKMLLKEVRGPKNGKSDTRSTQEMQPIQTSHSLPTMINQSAPKVVKPRKPPTERMLDWRKTFAEVRKRYPGRRGPEFDEALRKASAAYKQKWANRVQ